LTFSTVGGAKVKADILASAIQTITRMAIAVKLVPGGEHQDITIPQSKHAWRKQDRLIEEKHHD
jgi:hypothetical protein